MEEKIRKMLGMALGSAVMCLIVFGVFAVIALVGGNLMALFGFRYDGIGSLLLFFLLGAVVGLPLEVFSSAFPRALYAVGKISRWGGKRPLYSSGFSFYHGFVLADRPMDGKRFRHRVVPLYHRILHVGCHHAV